MRLRKRKNFVKSFRPALCVSVFAKEINWITLKESIYIKIIRVKKHLYCFVTLIQNK